MSNILPKKSWHVYNDKNREKVKKDETSARIEKEKTEERAKAAEREHRLSLLRSRANLPKTDAEFSPIPTKRFELFDKDDGQKDAIKGDYERELVFKKLSQSSSKPHAAKPQKTSNSNVEVDHWRHDPMVNKNASLTKKKSSNGKDYSFV